MDISKHKLSISLQILSKFLPIISYQTPSRIMEEGSLLKRILFYLFYFSKTLLGKKYQICLQLTSLQIPSYIEPFVLPSNHNISSHWDPKTKRFESSFIINGKEVIPIGW